MKARNILCSVMAVVAVSLLAGCETEKGAAKESQAQLMQQAKVSKADAEQTALAQVPGGTIKEGELEKEHGKLIWSFDVAKPGTEGVTEVNVDALTGKVISTEQESTKAEAKEKQHEKDDNDKK